VSEQRRLNALRVLRAEAKLQEARTHHGVVWPMFVAILEWMITAEARLSRADRGVSDE